MKLIRRPLDNGGTRIYIQLLHRRNAIEHAIAGIKALKNHNLNLLGQDPFNAELEETMANWVIETLLQGAYLREYHLWEKDCKAYFAEMAERNGAALKLEKGKSFVEQTRHFATEFSVVAPQSIMDAIDHMRNRVNSMKHDPGLTLEHFISSEEYESAMQALENFWEYLSSCETITLSYPSPQSPSPRR